MNHKIFIGLEYTRAANSPIFSLSNLMDDECEITVVDNDEKSLILSCKIISDPSTL